MRYETAIALEKGKQVLYQHHGFVLFFLKNWILILNIYKDNIVILFMNIYHIYIEYFIMMETCTFIYRKNPY